MSADLQLNTSKGSKATFVRIQQMADRRGAQMRFDSHAISHEYLPGGEISSLGRPSSDHYPGSCCLLILGLSPGSLLRFLALGRTPTGRLTRKATLRQEFWNS